MKIDQNRGLLLPATYLPSPHCDDRPANVSIDAIIIHNISLPPGEFGTGKVAEFFCGKLNSAEHPYFATIESLRVASHLFIDRKGAVTQFVPFGKRAWHAGVSNLHGRECCNDFSIGIELEGADNIPYEHYQYETLTRVISLLMKTYPIQRSNIVGHSDIAPGRKTDPGEAFDWARLQLQGIFE